MPGKSPDRAAQERIVAEVLDEWREDIPFMSTISLAQRIVAALAERSLFRVSHADESVQTCITIENEKHELGLLFRG